MSERSFATSKNIFAAESFSLGLSLLENGEALNASAHFAACASMAASQSDRPAQAQAMYHQACCAVVVQNWDVAAECLRQAISFDSSLAAFARGDDTLAPLLARQRDLLAIQQGTGLAAGGGASMPPALPPPTIDEAHHPPHAVSHQRNASGSSAATDSLMGHEAIRMARMARTDSRGSLISMVSMESQSQGGTPLPIAAARSRAGGLVFSTSLDSSAGSSPQHRREFSSGSSRHGNSMSSANGDILVTTRHARSVSNGKGAPAGLADVVGVDPGVGSGALQAQQGVAGDQYSDSVYRSRSESAGTLGLDLPDHIPGSFECEDESGDLGAIADAALATVQAEERFEAVQQAARRHSLQSLPESALVSPPVAIFSVAADELPPASRAPSVASISVTNARTQSSVSLQSPTSTGHTMFRQDTAFERGSGRKGDADAYRAASGPLTGAGQHDFSRPSSAIAGTHRRGRAKTDSLLLDLPPMQPSTPLPGQPAVLGFGAPTPRPSTAGAAAGSSTTTPQAAQGGSFWGNALRGIQAAFMPSSSRPPAASAPATHGSTATPRQPVPLFDMPCIDDSRDMVHSSKAVLGGMHKRTSRAASQEAAGPLDLSGISGEGTFASPRTTEPSPGQASSNTKRQSSARSTGFQVIPRGDSDASDVSLP